MKYHRRFKNVINVLCVLMLGLNGVAFAAPKAAEQPNPDFTKGGKTDGSHDWTLGPTGARGWIYATKGQTLLARQISVTSVAKGSPADGILAKDDVILGVGEKPFDGDARVLFANAITSAEEEKSGGLLKLILWRGGKSENVTLKIPVMGGYSATAPYDCPKSKMIFEQGCAAIAKKGLGNVSIPDDLNALALLASGKPEYKGMLSEYAKKVAEYHTESMATWYYGYAISFLAEYVIATGDKSVMPGLKRMTMEAALGQSNVGTWGHKFAMPSGNLNGYGCMNAPGLTLTISMVLAREAGVSDPALDKAITKASSFLRWYVNKGAVPYGDHSPWPGHEDNGKCSMAAVLFDLLGDREAAEFFVKMSTAGYSERERGHTGNFFNVLWALPAVARGGPLATGGYLKEEAWYYDLARAWDGSFAYQGSPVGEEEHGKYTRWDSTGAYLLSYALQLKSLLLTGKKPFSVPAMNTSLVAELIDDGRDYFAPSGVRGGAYEGRTAEQLLEGLSSWSPAVRKRSASALGKLEGDFVPTLMKNLSSPNVNARYGACEALGNLGPKADPAAPQLRALLKDKDPWMQCLAATSITGLSQEVRNDCIGDLLTMTATPNPVDSRGMVQRAAASALFSGSRGINSILANSLDGVDRNLLYPAIKAVLNNQDGAARGTLGRVYGKLSDQDVVALLPDIVKAIAKIAPSNEMFADGIRLSGLDLLSRLHIREGMELCVDVIEPNRWGSGKRVPQCLEYLIRYGSNAKDVLPQLEAISKGNVEIEKAIATIKASTASPTLVDMKDFKAKK